INTTAPNCNDPMPTKPAPSMSIEPERLGGAGLLTGRWKIWTLRPIAGPTLPERSDPQEPALPILVADQGDADRQAVLGATCRKAQRRKPGQVDRTRDPSRSDLGQAHPSRPGQHDLRRVGRGRRIRGGGDEQGVETFESLAEPSADLGTPEAGPLPFLIGQSLATLEPFDHGRRDQSPSSWILQERM